MEKEKKLIENVNEADQDKVKTAISRWNAYLFSKESDKNLFEYFLENTKKSHVLTQYPNVFLDKCIIYAINKLETMPMHHNMRLKQSFQFLLDNTEQFNPTEETINYLCEKSLGFKRTKANSNLDSYSWFSQLSSLVRYQATKDSEIIKYILENVLQKCSVDKLLDCFNKVDDSLLKEVTPIFANALVKIVEENPDLNDEIFLSIYYIENNKKQISLLDNILLSQKINDSDLLKECWGLYSEQQKQIVIGTSLMVESKNAVVEKLPGYTTYVKQLLELDLNKQTIINYSKNLTDKKKIELYFSLLEDLYANTEDEEKRHTIENYSREMYIKVIEQKRPDLTKGLISIKAEKSIIQTEDVPLFVYKVMSHFPKVMAYHLVIELLDSVKKAGKIKEFSDVFNTSKVFEVGYHKFEFDEPMKNEIKFIYYEYLTEKFKEDKKNITSKPVKRLKI